MNGKQWFLRTLAASMALLLFVGAFTYFADPFFYYRWDPDGEGVFVNQRYQAAGIVRNSRAPTLLLGTSMVSNFRAGDVEEAFGGSAEKVTIPDGHFSEFTTVLETAFAHHAPKRVVFSLDLNILVRDDAGAPGLPAYLYDENLRNDTHYLFNKDTFFYGLYAVHAKRSGNAVSADEAFTWDETTGFSTNYVLASYERPAQAAALPSNAFTATALNNTRTILSWAEAHPETQFIIYVPPYDILFWDKTEREGKTEALFTAMEESFRLLCSETKNVSLYLLSDLPMAKDHSYFNDYIHFNRLGSQEVLHALCEDGALYEVTRLNVTERLEAVRAFRDDYDYEALLQQKNK